MRIEASRVEALVRKVGEKRAILVHVHVDLKQFWFREFCSLRIGEAHLAVRHLLQVIPDMLRPHDRDDCNRVIQNADDTLPCLDDLAVQ